MLSDDNNESESTWSKAGQSDGDDVGSAEELDGAPRDPTSEPIGDGLNLGTMLLPSTRTAAHSSKATNDNNNNGIANDGKYAPPRGYYIVQARLITSFFVFPLWSS